jgi:tetratricopeptide (TPR) repeat protein
LGDFDGALVDAEKALQFESTRERRLLVAKALYHPETHSAREGTRWFAISDPLSSILTVKKVRWSGDPERAFSVLTELRDEFPDDAEIRLALGDLLWGQESWDSATVEYDRAFQLGREREGSLGLAHCEIMQGQREAASRRLKEIHKHDKSRLDAALGLFVLPERPSPGNWSFTKFRATGVFSNNDDRRIRILSEALSAKYAPESQQFTMRTLPTVSPGLRQLLSELDLNKSVEEDVADTLLAKGLETLFALREYDAIGPDFRALAATIRRRELNDDINTLSSIIVQSHLTGPSASDLFDRSSATVDHGYLLECLVGLIEDTDRPSWIRGAAMMSAADKANQSAAIKDAIIRAHDSSEPILYRHAVLALATIHGEDSLASLMRGTRRLDREYQHLLRWTLIDKTIKRIDELSIAELVSGIANYYHCGDRRFVELAAGRFSNLLIPYPGPQELNLFESVLRRTQDIESLYRMFESNELSQHEKSLLCQILQRWPDPKLAPRALRLARDNGESERVRVEAAGLLIACGDAPAALNVLDEIIQEKLVGEEESWPYRTGHIVSAARPWTPSLWLTTARVAQPGPMAHRAVLLVGQIRSSRSLEILLKCARSSLHGVRINALASLCDIATDPELAKDLDERFDVLRPLYEDPALNEVGNLCLLAGLLRRRDASVVHLLEIVAQLPLTDEGEIPLHTINARWALARIDIEGAEKNFHERVIAWINKQAPEHVRSVWYAAHLIETGRNLSKAEEILKEAKHNDTREPGEPPPVGLITTLAELEVVKGRLTEAKATLDELLQTPLGMLPDRSRFVQFSNWLENGASPPVHLSHRWQISFVPYEYDHAERGFSR